MNAIKAAAKPRTMAANYLPESERGKAALRNAIVGVFIYGVLLPAAIGGTVYGCIELGKWLRGVL